jgi:hypothetical protein
MSHHRLERRRRQRRLREAGKPVASVRVRSAALGGREHTAEPEPDALFPEVGIVRILS